jgi:enediyne biosynthesis thioesterase
VTRAFIHDHMVTFAETNLVGNVYFAHYVAWQGACRERFLAAHAPGVVARLTTDLALVTVGCSCDYFAELYALDRVQIRMTLAELAGNRITMEFGYFRTRDGGPAQLVARGRQEVACMTRSSDGLAPAEVPDELRAALQAYAS